MGNGKEKTMTDIKEYNKAFAKRLRYYLERDGMTQFELAKRLNVSPQSVTNWINAIKTPRMDKVDAMCDIFHCRRSDFSDDADESERHYIDDAAREYARFLHDNPEYGVLFDASRKVKAEDIDIVRQLLDKFRESEE